MAPLNYTTPGVYFRESSAPREVAIRTGVPVFIGFAADGRPGTARDISRWEQFTTRFGAPQQDRYLAYAVRGFFANSGTLCHVCTMERGKPVMAELERVLEELRHDPLAEDADLICGPDLQLFPGQETGLQQKILDFCRTARGDGRYLFAILDALPHADTETLTAQKGALQGDDGALYHPWIRVADGPPAGGGSVPPCGHLAGIYSRSDTATGVHKAPANELIEEALDLAVTVTELDQGVLNPENINCIRAFPGRGIRVWGARTVSRDPAFRYVNVRRLILALSRWIERRMAATLFEPNDTSLWLRMRRELGSYLGELHQKGAFQGGTAEEAFYVKCDAENNGPELRDRGELVVEVGVAAAVPGEFIIVRIVQSDGRVSVSPQGSPSPVGVPVPGQPGAAGLPQVVIAAILANPPGADIGQEMLTLANRGGRPVDMTNWLLEDRAGHRFVFPRFVFHPGAEVKVWTREGENSVTDLYWGHRAPLWNNTGDTAFLYDAQGNEITRFEYVG